MRILCRVTSLLLVLALCSSSSDATEPCTANCASLSCSGFSQRTMTCSNGTVYDIGYCYNPGAFVCPSAQFDGSLILTITGISPDQLLPYYALLQRAVKWAYNSFCLAGDNYKFCCPGARAWSKPNSGLSNYVAIASEASEVLVLAVRGDIGYSVVALSISPSRHSVLCNAVTYDTTAAAETTPIATTTIATVTSGDSSSSPSDSSSSAPSGSSTAAPSGSSTAAPSGSSTAAPTESSTDAPTESSTAAPSGSSTAAPSGSSTAAPSGSSTAASTESSTAAPSGSSTAAPTESSTAAPGSSTAAPSDSSTAAPSDSSTAAPSGSSTAAPFESSTAAPFESSTTDPSESSTADPSESSTADPSESSTADPSESSTADPSESSTADPSDSSTTSTTLEVDTTSSGARRRRRDVDLVDDIDLYDLDLLESVLPRRFRRSTGQLIVLSDTAVSSIISSANISVYIRSELESVNYTVSISMTFISRGSNGAAGSGTPAGTLSLLLAAAVAAAVATAFGRIKI